MRIMVLGATGMIANTVFPLLGQSKDLEVIGTSRSTDAGRFFDRRWEGNFRLGIDVEDHDVLVDLFRQIRPGSTIYVNRFRRTGPHLPIYQNPCKVRSNDRLRSERLVHTLAAASGRRHKINCPVFGQIRDS